jgi:hypothetical protein
MVKSIIFSIEPISDRSKGQGAVAEASQQWTGIIHVPGSGLGVEVMITRCTLLTLRIEGSWQWRIAVAMDHLHPANGFGNSEGLSRVQPFIASGRSL